ncbi:MAG: PaaI family thioesterase, partial [Clostridia bacterium]|nr:PaaI family thioesterase [Clostridia bacterium]
MMKNVERMKKFFTKDEYVALSGITIDAVNEDSAVVSVQLENKHCNANGFAQGGLIYTLADFAFAVLSNYNHPVSVTQCGNISYLRPGTGKKLIATAREVERAGHNSVCE